MGRAGRKRKPGVVRTPSGRISRALAEQNDNIEGIQVRMRHLNLSEKDARDQKSETRHGLLLLKGVLTNEQYDAAEDYRRLYEAYKRAMKSPDAMRNSDGAGSSSPDSEAHDKWCIAVVAKWDATVKAIAAANGLRELKGCQLYAALDYLVLRNEEHPHLVGDCALGLTVLAAHFRLTAPAKQSIRGRNSTVNAV